jgi:DNA gyrase subunit A
MLLATASGMAIRFNEEDARLMGRSAAGVKGIELEEGDEVIGMAACRW